MIGKIILGYFLIGLVVGVVYLKTTFKSLEIYRNPKYQLLMKSRKTKIVINTLFVLIYAVIFPFAIKDMITGGKNK